MEKGSRIPTKLVYFTDEVEKYMHAADLLVTKPGGLTVSEALACNLPMAVFDAIPGQEEDNANFLKTHDMCVRLQKGGGTSPRRSPPSSGSATASRRCGKPAGSLTSPSPCPTCWP